MAWQVGLVLDTETEVEPLLGMMPVWAVGTPERKANAQELRKAWESHWSPESGLTLWSNSSARNTVESLPGDIFTVEEHHPYMACLRLFGIAESELLIAAMTEIGYHRLTGTSFPGLGFGRSIENLSNVREIALDAADWSSRDDFYSAFFQAVGAPAWHGRNFDALVDSIQTGSVNQIEVPYKIVVQNSDSKNPEIRGIVGDFADLVRHMQANGCPVSLTVDA